MPEIITPTDHDILTTLSADFRNMKESQEAFHKDMKEAFADFKYNLADRLTKVETGLIDADKVYAAKKVEDEKDEKADARITKLELWQQRIIGALIIINIILGLVMVFAEHLIK